MARSRRWRYQAFYLDAASTEAVNTLVRADTNACFTSNLFRGADLIASFLALLHRALEGDDCAQEAAQLRCVDRAPRR